MEEYRDDEVPDPGAGRPSTHVPDRSGVRRVPRIGRILDLAGFVVLATGVGLRGRAWLGFREVQDFVPGVDQPAMAAVQLADSFWRLEKIGTGLIVLGVAVFVAAWWVARRGTSA